ncbi:MAG: hypothetical protein WA783_13720 [Phormidesmis sp.]
MKLIKYGSRTVVAALATVLASTLAPALKAIAQTEQLPEDPTDPLISHGSDLAIYSGLALLALALVFAIKSFNSKLERVLIFAFGLSIMMMIILWYL